MMGKLQTCSILLQRWWYSSKLSDTFCMLLLQREARRVRGRGRGRERREVTHTALVICRPASSKADEFAKWKVPKREERRLLILSHWRERGRRRETLTTEVSPYKLFMTNHSLCSGDLVLGLPASPLDMLLLMLT